MGQIAQILLLSIFVAVVNSAHFYIRQDGTKEGFSLRDETPGSLFDLFVPKKTEERATKPFVSNDDANPDKLTNRSIDKDIIEKEALDRNVKINSRKPLGLKMPGAKKDNQKNEDEAKVPDTKVNNPLPLNIDDGKVKQPQTNTPVPDLGSIVFRDTDSEEITSNISPKATEIPKVNANNTVLKENVTITPNVTGRFGEFLVFVPNTDAPVSNQNVLVPLADTYNNQIPQTQSIPVNYVPVNSIQNAQANSNGIPVLYDPTTNTVQTAQNLQAVKYLPNVQNYQPVQSQSLQPIQNVQPTQTVQNIPVQNLQSVQYVPMTLQPNNVANGSPLYAIIQLPVQNFQAQNPNVFYVNNLPSTYQNNVPIYSLVPLSNGNGNYVSIPNSGNNLG